MLAAVHHTMANGDQPMLPELLTQKVSQMGDGTLVPEGLALTTASTPALARSTRDED